MEPDHPEPFSDGTHRALERLMALGVLIEAGSRLAAENARAKANRAEQHNRDDAAREREDQKATRLAHAEESRRERDWARFAADGDRLREHLDGLPFQEVARHWGQAARHADTNPTAATVLAGAEDELRRRAPGLMDQYAQQRDAGLSRPGGDGQRRTPHLVRHHPGPPPRRTSRHGGLAHPDQRRTRPGDHQPGRPTRPGPHPAAAAQPRRRRLVPAIPRPH
jgi:hypothetical protein